MRAVSYLPGEAVEHGFVACRIQLEHRSFAVGAALPRSAIWVALRILHYTRKGIFAGGRAEGIQPAFVAARIHLEQSPTRVSLGTAARVRSGAVQVALRAPH